MNHVVLHMPYDIFHLWWETAISKLYVIAVAKPVLNILACLLLVFPFMDQKELHLPYFGL